MKNPILRVVAVFLSIFIIAGIFYGCNKIKEPNEGINVYVDPDGITYLAIEDSNDGHTLAGVTDKDGNLYAAEIDESGKVLSDGNLYPVDYNGELPTNDTTAVSINQSNSDNFANESVITDPTGTTKQEEITTEPTSEKTTSDSSEDTTSKKNEESTTTTTNPTTEKKTYLADKYNKLLESGTYFMEFSTTDEEMEGPVTVAVKNGNIYMKTKLENLNCQMIYIKDKDSLYVVMTDYHIYCKMPSSMMEELDMSGLTSAGISESVKVTVANVTIGGKDCVSETYTMKDGSVTIYYFYNEELVRIDQIEADGTSSVMSISAISSKVDDSLFQVPRGYVPFNLSRLNLDKFLSDDKEKDD